MALPADLVLPVDKPVGPTSHDVAARARKALGTPRVGHTGTLDPFASGLLLLCVGRATRVAEYLTGLDKSYEATARLGLTTDTLDREGRVVEERDGWATLDPHRVADVLGGFRGVLDQVPPQYSAKKVGGEAMHRRARRGERVELEPRRVTIHEIELVTLDPPMLDFRVRCSSGTYVRALARDLGEALGVGAHLTELRRTAIGGLGVDRAIRPEALADRALVAGAALSPLVALRHLPALEVGDEAARRLGLGQAVPFDHEAARLPAADLPVVVVAHGDEIVAIAEARDGLLHPRKVFHA